MPIAVQAPKHMPPSNRDEAKRVREPVADAPLNCEAGRLYREVIGAADSGWFTLSDCVFRYSLTVLMVYWAILTTPISFVTYLMKYCKLWYGPPGLLLALSFPVLPLAIAFLVAVKRVKSLFVPDWSMAGPGKVFFLKPSNPIGAFLWDCYLTQSMLVGQFYLVGTSDAAIQHTYHDILLTKDFWRAALSKQNARLPRELARWTGEQLAWRYPLDKSDVVVKIPDSYLGIGDSFWNHGEQYSSQEELEKLLQQEYKGKDAMVLELCRPKKTLGVHSLDIVTLRTPDDDVKVLSVLLWTDCTNNSSHSCRAGYVVDVETEKIVAAAKWYSPFFAQMDAPLVGTTLKGVKQAVKTAVETHRNIEEKWLTAVGWDCMIMEDETVFFEGNFAGARTPRRIFLNWACFSEFVRHWAWPFGRSMRPL